MLQPLVSPTLRAHSKITSHFRIPSSGHLRPILNRKVLEIDPLLFLWLCNFGSNKSDLNLGANSVKLFLSEPLAFAVFCQETIQLVREGLPVFPAETRRTALDYATISQLIHQVAHSQPVLDVFLGIEIASRVKGICTLCNNTVCEGDIRCNHQVAL